MHGFKYAAGMLLIGFAVASQAAAPQANPPYVKGQVVVRGAPTQFDGGQVIKYLPLSNLTVLAVEPGRELAEVARQRGVGREAMLNLQAQAFDVDDPFRSYQWHLDSIQAPWAWQTATGAGVVVAVLDTGLAASGVDGIGCVDAAATDIVNNDNDPDDGDGHGTHVSGTIAQASNNSTGVAGVAWGSCIMPVKVLSDEGSGSFADIAEGIYWAVEHGARVINMSLGVSARYRVTSDPVMDAALDAAYAAGVTVVAAAGNDGYRRNVSYPAIYPTTIAVGATDARDLLAPYSNQGTGLDLVAPGGNTSRDDTGDGYGDGVLQETRIAGSWGYYFFQGTSMATPHVAAAAALLLQANPALGPDQVRDKLVVSALDLGAAGYDSSYGHGLIQLGEALVDTNPPDVVNQNPVAAFSFICSELVCDFDAGGSSDPDGSLPLSYNWSFGDYVNGEGIAPSHTYAQSGDYLVTLTVSDSAGGSDQTEKLISVMATPTGGGCTDADADGFCSEATGGEDCNDEDAHVYPGHNDTKGRWGKDGVDNDCNDVIDG